MKASSTAVFRFVMNSSSGYLDHIWITLKVSVSQKQSLDQTRNESGNEGRKKRSPKPTLLLTQNTQADLTHHLFSTSIFHRSSASSTCPNQPITCNVTSRRASCLIRRVHEEELEDLVEVRRGEQAQHRHASEHSTPTRQFCVRHCEKGVEESHQV